MEVELITINTQGVATEMFELVSSTFVLKMQSWPVSDLYFEL